MKLLSIKLLLISTLYKSLDKNIKTKIMGKEGILKRCLNLPNIK